MALSEDDCVNICKYFSYSKNLKAAYIDTPHPPHTQAAQMFLATGTAAALGILDGPTSGFFAAALAGCVTAYLHYSPPTPSKPLYLVIIHELTTEEKRELGSVVKNFFHNESAVVKCQNLANGSVGVTFSSNIVEHGFTAILEKFFKEKKNLTFC